MSAKVRLIDAATARSSRIRSEVGRELRHARHGRSLSQLTIARAIRLPQSTISEIERGVQEGVTVAALARFAAAVGLDLSVRLYPAGEPIRDAAHERLLSRFRSKVGERWDWAAEVPLPMQGDRRAWDRLLRGAGVRIGVEGETRPSDLQELQRRLALKKRDGAVDRLVLVLPDTDWCRRVLRLNDLTMAFPIPGNVALRALQEGRDPGGDAVILI